MNAKEIRSTFLDFFASKEHTIVASAPIVVKNDPTLMFTNAGMNQFKDIFLGDKAPFSKRVADTQKWSLLLLLIYRFVHLLRIMDHHYIRLYHFSEYHKQLTTVDSLLSILGS